MVSGQGEKGSTLVMFCTLLATIAIENGPRITDLPGKVVILRNYVRLPEGIFLVGFHWFCMFLV